jgi:hypothetical protein
MGVSIVSPAVPIILSDSTQTVAGVALLKGVL